MSYFSNLIDAPAILGKRRNYRGRRSLVQSYI